MNLPEAGVGLRLLGVFVLVLLNAFFVAAEFSLVGSRRSRIDQMAETGSSGAKAVQNALKNLDRAISGTQLGITLASLALGWIGEPALATIVDGGLAMIGIHARAGAIHTTAGVFAAFLVITFLHIVLGELVPKSIAIVSPESVSTVLARPLMLFSRVMSPFITLLNRVANALLSIIGVSPPGGGHQSVHTPDELRLLVMQARAQGTLNENDSMMLAGVFDFHEKKARDVMRPRTEVAAIPLDASEDDVWKILRTERYSRYPVIGESIDDIIGVFLAKDLWLHQGPFTVQQFVRSPLLIPDSRPAERVLDDLRKTRAHMAVVLDEYGGTAGIITMEDLVEEVVGDIADEYDAAAREALETDGVLELAGSLSLIDVRSDYKVMVPDGDWTTLGGYVFNALGRLPRIGDRVTIPGCELEVVAMDGRRVAAIRVNRSPSLVR